MNDYRANFDVMFANLTNTMIGSTQKALDDSSRWWTATDKKAKTVTVDGRDAILIG